MIKKIVIKKIVIIEKDCDHSKKLWKGNIAKNSNNKVNKMNNKVSNKMNSVVM